MNLWALGFAAAATVAGASLRWRWAFYGALVTAVLEGAFRKWFFPGAGNFIYFAKDLLLCAAYIGFWLERQTIQGRSVPAFLLLWLTVAALAFQLVNPNSNSFLLSLIGIKPYLFYLPLLYITQFAFRTRQEFERFLRYFLLLAIPVFLLGVVQFTRPPDSVWNKYAHEGAEDVAAFGLEAEFARITGTFSYIAGLTTYILLIGSLAIPMALFSSKSLWRWIFVGVTVLAVGNTFMTGSRAPVVGLALLVVGFWSGSQFLGLPAEQKRAPLHLLVALVGVVAAVTLFQSAAEAIKNRASESFEEGGGRATQYFTEPWAYAKLGGLAGFGAGLTLGPTAGLQAALHLQGPKQSAPPLEVESSRIMVEVGWPTFMIWHLFRLYVLIALWQVRAQLRDPLLRQLALGAFLASLYYLSTGIVVNHIAGLFSWFLAGFICTLPRFDAVGMTPPSSALRRRLKRSRTGTSTESQPTAAGTAALQGTK